MLQASAGALDDGRRLALLHCVMCHHGPSLAPGGKFASPEAMALYRLNALDAGVWSAGASQSQTAVSP
jgi:3'-5' exoribonuclease